MLFLGSIRSVLLNFREKLQRRIFFYKAIFQAIEVPKTLQNVSKSEKESKRGYS